MACLAIQFNAIFVTITEVQPYAWAGQLYQGPGTDFTSFVWQHTTRRKQGQLQLLAMWALPETPRLHGRLPGGTEPGPGLLRGAPAPSAVLGPGSPLRHRGCSHGQGADPARI